MGKVAEVSINVGSVFAAPMAIIAFRDAIGKKEFLISLGALVVAGLSITHNMTNALDKVAKGRAEVSEGRTKVSGEVSRLMERRQNATIGLQEGRRRSQGVSTDILDQDIATLRMHKIYKRTEGCKPEHVTVEESRDWCSIFRGSTARLEAAKTVERLDNEIREIDAALEGKGPVAVDADPQVANLATLLHLDDRYLLAVILNTKTAVLVEIIGTLGPMLLQYLFRMIGRREEEPAPESPTGITIKDVVAAVPLHVPADDRMNAVVLLPPPQQHVEMFVQQCLDRVEGAESGATPLYMLYLEWYSHTGREEEPLKQHQFGPSLVALGIPKIKRKRWYYQGVVVKTSVPRKLQVIK